MHSIVSRATFALVALCLAAVQAKAQDAGTNMAPLVLGQCIGDNGVPVSGCRAYTYQAGTTTAEPLYSDQARTTSHGAYVTADSLGRFPDAYCDVSQPLKIKLTDSTGASLGSNHTKDNVDCPLGASQIANSLAALGLDGTAAAATIGTSGDVIVKANTANTWSGQQTFSAGTIHSSTAADATAGPEVQTYRNSTSPASDDLLGILTFYGEDGAGNKELYSACKGEIIDPSSGSEYGAILCDAIINAVNTNIVRIGSLDSSDPTVTGIDLLEGEYFQAGRQITGPRHIETKTASASANLDFETIPAGCDIFRLRLFDFKPATDDVALYVTLKYGGSYASADYRYMFSVSTDDGSTPDKLASQSASQIFIGDATAGDSVGNGTSESLWAIIEIYNPLGTTNFKQIRVNAGWLDADGNQDSLRGSASYTGAATATQGVRAAMESGNIASGTAVAECEFLP